MMSTQSPSTPCVATSNALGREGDGEFVELSLCRERAWGEDHDEGRLSLSSPRV